MSHWNRFGMREDWKEMAMVEGMVVGRVGEERGTRLTVTGTDRRGAVSRKEKDKGRGVVVLGAGGGDDYQYGGKGKGNGGLVWLGLVEGIATTGKREGRG
ncbi:hypothetical protein ACH5RR_015964 [Cinchona calisaya]|uniref:Uncharacterized protein n=1 Tax=Cinchona calisaya TaxID=153742 RepID=A0ABD2ZUJ5_9GENT